MSCQLKTLSSEERALCLNALVFLLKERDLLEDWEFHSRIGYERGEISVIVAEWPKIESYKGHEVDVVVNNCLNELINGLNIGPDIWIQCMHMSRDRAEEILSKFKI